MAPLSLLFSSLTTKLFRSFLIALRICIWIPWLLLLSNLIILHHPAHVTGNQCSSITIGHCILATIGIIVIQLVINTSRTDYFTLAEDLDRAHESKMRPKFFFSTTRHLRLRPNGYFFQYPILYIGMSTKFIDTIGCLFSIKESKVEHENPYRSIRKNKPWFTFFNIDPKHYMSSEFGFDEKARNFLRLNGVDDSLYPHIYLITSPSFLWWHFNPVTYWYIYTKDYHLAYSVLEVSNTFGESHAYLLPREGSEQKNNRFLYTCCFTKDFHISPFNKRSGQYEVDVFDVVAEGKQDVKVTVLDEEGKKRMTVQTFSHGVPLDMLDASLMTVVWMVTRWALCGFLIVPRTLWECVRIFLKKDSETHERPEPYYSSKSRPPSVLEKACQQLFLDFLRNSLHRYLIPVEVILTLPRSDIGVPPVSYKFISKGCHKTSQRFSININVTSHLFWFKALTKTTFSELYETEIRTMEPALRYVEASDWKLTIDILDNQAHSYEPIDTNQTISKTSLFYKFVLYQYFSVTNRFFRILNGENLETSPMYLYYRYKLAAPITAIETTDNQNSYDHPERFEPATQNFKNYSTTMFAVTWQMASSSSYEKFIHALKWIGCDLEFLPAQ